MVTSLLKHPQERNCAQSGVWTVLWVLEVAWKRSSCLARLVEVLFASGAASHTSMRPTEPYLLKLGRKAGGRAVVRNLVPKQWTEYVTTLSSCYGLTTLHGIVGTLIGAIQIPGREKRGQPAEASALDSIVRANKVDGRVARRILSCRRCDAVLLAKRDGYILHHFFVGVTAEEGRGSERKNFARAPLQVGEPGTTRVILSILQRVGNSSDLHDAFFAVKCGRLLHLLLCGILGLQ
mmetsp:Transcript_7351/g.27027  ORF Transcript_7351/g.27027 Transcript_7351/m.27027 type:complete len:236 (+) Transcript_7351:616-1323(+)